MGSAKQEVTNILEKLPDNATLEDIQYHLFVLQKIERGLKEAEAEKVFSHEEVEKKMAKWLTK